MARPAGDGSRPGRALLLLLALVLAMGGTMILQGAYLPLFGLDLAGGTTVTLSPVTATGQAPARESLDLAVTIIRDRVNGSGLSDAEVARSGGTIVVSVPGAGQEEVVELVGATAELRFRRVLAMAGGGSPAAGRPTGTDLGGIDGAVLERFRRLDCTGKDRGQDAHSAPDAQIAACSRDGRTRYILDKAVVVGTDIGDAQVGVDPTTGQWLVQLALKGTGPRKWGEITTAVYRSPPPRNRIAAVLDGLVISAPIIHEPITGGRARIGGGFSQESANELANQLKYGALPLRFEKTSIEEISSTLGRDQLTGGVIAGGIGLALVVLYSLLYYRGLGIVAVLSLGVAAVVTYQAVVLLGHNTGFRLSLPHLIGLIVSIGVTADSFIVYFERIRDEMREGRRPLRSAVAVAWARARRTILIADAVMFIAAAVLYYIAVGGVAGFAFAMGLTTLIDIVVVFLFTRPLVALLARVRFFAEGHRLSGLDRERMGRRTSSRATTVPGDT